MIAQLLNCDNEAGGIWVTVRRVGSRIKAAPVWDGLTQLAILGVCFLAGGLSGFFFSGLGGDSSELMDHLRFYFQSAGQGSVEPSLWSSVWDLTRWPLLAFLLGSTALGALGLPILLGVRGFLLSFSAATLARLFGLPGVAASLAVFGVTALVAVPVLFVVSVDAFRQSLGRLSGERSPAWNQRIQVLSPCVGLLVLAVALQQTLMPALLTVVCRRLFVT